MDASADGVVGSGGGVGLQSWYRGAEMPLALMIFDDLDGWRKKECGALHCVADMSASTMCLLFSVLDLVRQPALPFAPDDLTCAVAGHIVWMKHYSMMPVFVERLRCFQW